MFDPDYSVHPGEILRDELAARGIEPDAEMQAVLDGGVLSDALAERLKAVLGTGAHAWKNLMWQYYEWAMKRFGVLFDKSIDDGPLADEEKEEFDRLTDLIEAYEDEHYPIGKPSLEDILEFWEDQRPDKTKILQEYVDCAKMLVEEGMTEGDVNDWLYQKQCMLNGRTVMDLIMTGHEDEIAGFLIKLKSWTEA